MLFRSDGTDIALQAEALVTLLQFGCMSPGIRHRVTVSSWKNDLSAQMAEKLSNVEVIKQRQGHSKVRTEGGKKRPRLRKTLEKYLFIFRCCCFSLRIYKCRKFLSRRSQEEINIVTVRLLDLKKKIYTHTLGRLLPTGLCSTYTAKGSSSPRRNLCGLLDPRRWDREIVPKRQ
jgi:hypothetical protein